MIIFSYGSNMNVNRLHERVPSAVKVCNAYIKGYTLRCNKISRSDGSAKANICQSNNTNDIVWGVLFDIADDEKPNLDRVEGLGNGYNETILAFTDANDTIHQAQVYIADNNSINNALQPYDWYRLFILSGAEQNYLPQDYIQQLQSLGFTIDTNEERKQRNLNLLNAQR